MKYELGEFTDGKAKGFKYWYPLLELGRNELPHFSGDIIFNPDLPQVIDGGHELKLVYYLNMALKSRIADQVKQKMKPLFDGDASKGLAVMFPDGILNKQDTCLSELLK